MSVSCGYAHTVIKVFTVLYTFNIQKHLYDILEFYVLSSVGNEPSP